MDLNSFEIEFAKLSVGKNNFSWDISPEFFSRFEDNIIEMCEGKVELELEKAGNGTFYLDFKLSGKMNLECGRCLNRFDLKFNKNYGMEIIVSSDAESEDEDIIVVGPDVKTINLAPYINELFILQLPMRATCDLSGLKCNQEMVKMIKNYQSNKAELESDEDPRWEALKNLKK